MDLFSERTSLIDTENAFKVGPYITQVESDGHKVIRCNLGEPDFALPKHIREEVKRQIDNDLTHYCDPQGILPLREAIAKDVGAKRGLHITPDRVVVFPGAKPPIGFCQQTQRVVLSRSSQIPFATLPIILAVAGTTATTSAQSARFI